MPKGLHNAFTTPPRGSHKSRRRPRRLPKGPQEVQIRNHLHKALHYRGNCLFVADGPPSPVDGPPPGTAPRGDLDAPQDASPNDPRSQHPFQNDGQPYMFEAHEFELPMNFEGLWMVSKTPGTAARGAPNAPKDCQRDHGPREASTYVCYDVWYYMCVCTRQEST